MASSVIQGRNDSGTTNITGITWNRSGNVVNVSIQAAPTTSTKTVVTGLPTPKGDNYQMVKTLYGTSYVGTLEYLTASWTFQSTNPSYGSLTYICE